MNDLSAIEMLAQRVGSGGLPDYVSALSTDISNLARAIESNRRCHFALTASIDAAKNQLGNFEHKARELESGWTAIR